MREDMNKYNTSYTQVPSQRTEGEFSQSAGATAKTLGGMVWKAFKTLFWVLAISGVLVFLSVMSIILSYRNSEPPNISAMKLNYSSFLYLDGEDGASTEYMAFYSSENRVWVYLSEIPDYMKTAQIAIEDHRFSEHKGVDWKGTLGAVYKLFTHAEGAGGGGSTLTQQLIKNITGENQVSILRKVKEIFTALNLESGYTDSQGVKHVGYSKEEILEAYLNVVNYGGQCQGVQAAANHYFDKDISQCSLAECALIAGITQNPYQYNPMLFEEESKERAKVVLDRMKELSDAGELQSELTTPITESEYNDALAELETMQFVGAELEEEDYAANQDESKWNDYIDTMVEDLIGDLCEKYSYSYDQAESLLYNGGLEIHSSVDMDLQNDISNYFLTNTEMLPSDEAIELAFFMMDPYTGKVLAIVGRRGERSGMRLGNYATGIGMAGRQSGSSIKPISPYAVGLNEGVITYGTVLKDEPIPEYSEDNDGWPVNFDLQWDGTMNVDRAIEESQNAPAAWLCKDVTPEACYDWLTNKLHFTSLVEDDATSIAAMALGGQTYGVYLREMVAGYQIYANGGVYHKPITYDYVKDHDGNVILDNRLDVNPGEQVMSEENATIMNKLLHRPIYGSMGTATSYLSDLDTEIFGKTGTTDDNYDLWFIGSTPFATFGMWNGYVENMELEDSTTVKVTVRAVLQHLLENYDWSGKSWVLSDNVVERTFCRDSGKLAGSYCLNTASGWYAIDNVPETCNGGSDHISGKNVASPSPSASSETSVAPSIEPSLEPESTPENTSSETSSAVASEPPVSSTPDVTSESPTPPVEPTPESPISSSPQDYNVETFTPDVPVG